MEDWASSSDSQSTASGVKDGSEDWMLRIELDAAEALAALAHSAVPENEIRGSNEGGRPNQRVKNESPPGDSGMNPALPVLRSSDPVKQCEKMHSATMKSVKVEQDAELPKPSPMFNTSYEFFSSNHVKTLTEEEKEARRIRRVLANRESARKTIRRRQAIYEEMNTKAASLALENENLKREKELALEEYDNLKRTNECLKAQMVQTIKTEIEEIQEDSKSSTTNAEIPTSSTSSPFLLYNQPQFSPFLWSPIIQSSNPMQLQHGSQNAIFVPPRVDSLREQKNPTKITGPGTPLYIMPCPWFFPLPDHGNGIHVRSPSDLNDERNETAICNQSGTSSSPKTIPSIGTHPIEVKTKTSSLAEFVPAHNFQPTNNFQEGRRGNGYHPKGFLLVSSPPSSIRPMPTVKQETCHQPNYSPNDQVFSSTSSHAVNALPKTDQAVIFCPTVMSTEAAAAAEARKRRKELTKLKNLHCRQFQMHC